MSFVPVPAATLNQWVRILGALEKKINRQSFETWLKPTRFSHIVDRTLYVRIPSAEFQHIGDRYGDLIGEAIDNMGLELDSVIFQEPAPDPSAARLREDGGFAPQSSSTCATSSIASSSAPATSSRMPPRRLSPSAPPRPTTRSSCTAESAWARRTSCRLSATA